jgi:hypothetical protein
MAEVIMPARVRSTGYQATAERLLKLALLRAAIRELRAAQNITRTEENRP